MILTGTVARVEADHIRIRLDGGKIITVRRNDDAWEKKPVGPPHAIFISGFDCPMAKSNREIFGLRVTVDTDWFMHGIYVAEEPEH